MYEQDGETLDSLRESSAFEMAIKTAESQVEVLSVLHESGLSEKNFINRFPVLAKTTLGLPDVPDEAAPPV